MKKKITTVVSMLILSSCLHAGNNSQATLGDVKEAVYKLIMQNKEAKNKLDKIQTNDSLQDDDESKYIRNFVAQNKETLDKILN